MAKGSPFTTFSGKIGQTVGYILRNSNNGQTQGIRAYQPSVSNPQTVQQANQRIVLKPVNYLARILSSVIDRGFEGVSYGAASRQRFLSLNMADFRGPWIDKGNEVQVPGPVILSQGSLPAIVTTFEGNNTYLVTDLITGTGTISNFGDLSQRLISNNTDIKNGDQITFVAVIRVVGSDDFVYRVASVVVDTTSTDGTIIAGNGYFITSVGGFLVVELRRTDDEILVAGAAIQSRDGSGNVHLRSSSRLAIAAGVVDEWFSAAALQSAIASYMSTDANDWPVDPLNNDPLRPTTVTVDSGDISSGTSTTASGYLSEGGQIGLYLYRDGSNYYVLDSSGRRINTGSAAEPVYVTLTAAGISKYVTSGLWQARAV